MRFTSKMVSAVLAALLAIGFAAGVSAQPVNKSVSGVVKSIDTAGGSLILTESKTGSEITMEMPAEKVMFFRQPGSQEDMQEGRGAEAAGKIAEDQKSVETRVLIVYTDRDRGGNKLLGDKRADGKLAKEGDKWFVVVKDQKVEIVPSEKIQRLKFSPATVADLKEGDKISAYGKVDGDKMSGVGFFGIEKKD